MTSYSEDALIEQPAIKLFAGLRWKTVNCYDEVFGENGTLGRISPAEVILQKHLRAAIEKLNPDINPDTVNKAIEELTRDRSTMSLVAANRETYQLLKEGVKVTGNNPDSQDDVEKIKIIDWSNPANNEFLLCSQLWVTGEMYTRRTDLVGFVNGIPLIFMELKASHKRLENAYKDNLRDYKTTIPQLFWYNGFIILSNGSQTKLGSVTSQWEHFSDWKKINSEGEEGVISLDTVIKGTCQKQHLLDLVENFVLFEEAKGGFNKLVAKNHQYLGVNAAIASLNRIRPATLTPIPSPTGHKPSPQPSPNGRGNEKGEGAELNYRGGYYFAGLLERARQLRQKQTKTEEILWQLLRDRQLCGLKFRRQHQIGDYIADFFCHEAKLVIEIDGGVHQIPERLKHDQTRDKYLTSIGFTVIRFSNEQINNDIENVLQTIIQTIPSLTGYNPSLQPSPTGRGSKGEGNADGRLGVFWHTQGSGKSYSMIFFAQKIFRKISNRYTFVIVTDRDELDGQIYKNFARTGAVTEKEAQATSGEDLKQKLNEDHRYIFTLIQKFHTEPGEKYPKLSDRDDIIVITDEAHRSQYDTFALNMRNALPKAAFIGFTGTPLMAKEEKTRRVFGDYVSIYNFKQSVDDKATVPLYYENRIPELQLTNKDLNEDMEEILEEAELDSDQEAKLEREFAREYHLITRDPRLDKIAQDIVTHFTGRGFAGKAMVVSIDKATAVKMYDKVQKYWKDYLSGLIRESKTATGEQREILNAKIAYMKETDMAVVVSQAQNEIEDMKAKGIDIKRHRRRMVKEDLDEKFKDPKDPFRIVFVCAMWMTGFDVPCCSTIYLDKPMRNHTLMQTIARANRVFGEKKNGLIVDYVGVFRNLQKALAIYGSDYGGGLKEGETPVKDKSELVEELRRAMSDVEQFCKEQEINLENIERAEGFDRVKLLDDAVDTLVVNDQTKRKYLLMASLVVQIFKAILPDPAATELSYRCRLISVIAEKIRSLIPKADISEVMGEVETLLDDSIAAEGYIIHEVPEEKRIDLSTIDFEALKKQFAKSRKHIEVEKLRGAINSKLKRLVQLNRTRIDYLVKFQEMIDEYNSGSMNVNDFFKRLTDFAQELNDEEKRGIAEQLSEEELTIFDLLTKPDMSLTEKEKKQVKKVAKELLATLHNGKLVIDWRKKQQSQASVQVAIADVLESLPEEKYDQKLYQKKCSIIYQHIFDSYYGEDRSIYAVAG
jgi:type I restriction enzyme R subunit